jgi:transposase-like protein
MVAIFFERLYIDDDDVTEVRYQEPFGDLQTAGRTWLATLYGGRRPAPRQAKSPDTKGAGALQRGWAALLASASLDAGSSKTALVEVLRHHSNNYGAVQRVDRLTRQLAQRPMSEPSVTPRSAHQPSRLSQRLSAETVSEIIAAYQAGATTREVGRRFGLAHSSVNKLLRAHGVSARRRSPSADEMRRAIELYEAGLSTRVIAQHLGCGASTILRALTKAGVTIRTRFSVEPPA